MPVIESAVIWRFNDNWNDLIIKSWIEGEIKSEKEKWSICESWKKEPSLQPGLEPWPTEQRREKLKIYTNQPFETSGEIVKGIEASILSRDLKCEKV